MSTLRVPPAAKGRALADRRETCVTIAAGRVGAATPIAETTYSRHVAAADT